MVQRRWAFLLWAVLFTWGASAWAAPVAYIHELVGTAQTRVGTAITPLKVGDTLEEGAAISTGANSTATVKFEDGQIIVLHENSSFGITQYRYVVKDVKASNVLFDLVRGGLRFVTGVIGATNKGAFRVKVGTATVGIRGTDGTILIDVITQVVTAAVNAGVAEIANPFGTSVINPGQFSSAPPRAAPPPAGPVAAAPAVIAAVVRALAAAPVPVNTPVVVQASARAAAAKAASDAADAKAKAAPQDTAAQAEAAAAKAAADAALNAAVQAATQAVEAATQGGAVPPAPPAPPPPSPIPTPTPSEPAPTPTTTTPSTTSGSAGGGGTASPQ